MELYMIFNYKKSDITVKITEFYISTLASYDLSVVESSISERTPCLYHVFPTRPARCTDFYWAKI